jgi:hypothetical protein
MKINFVKIRADLGLLNSATDPESELDTMVTR